MEINKIKKPPTDIWIDTFELENLSDISRFNETNSIPLDREILREIFAVKIFPVSRPSLLNLQPLNARRRGGTGWARGGERGCKQAWYSEELTGAIIVT